MEIEIILKILKHELEEAKSNRGDGPSKAHEEGYIAAIDNILEIFQFPEDHPVYETDAEFDTDEPCPVCGGRLHYRAGNEKCYCFICEKSYLRK